MTTDPSAKGLEQPDKALIGELCLLSFVLMLTYALGLTGAQTLFLKELGAQALPYVWLGTAAASLVASASIGMLSARMPVERLFAQAAVVSALVLLVLIASFHAQPAAISFLLYVWKDIYIIALAELFWTFANVAFGVRSASRAYGLFCAAGSVAGVVGGYMSSLAVDRVGARLSLITVVPLLFLAGGLAKRLAKRATVTPETTAERAVRRAHPLRSGLGVLKKSPYLLTLLVLVAVVQITVNLIDFEFQRTLALTYSSDSARGHALGNMTTALNAISLVLQLGTALLIQKLGMVACLFAAPILVALALGASSFLPAGLGMMLCQLTTKSLDYSLFRATKEILYIPLTYAEKTQGKAIIDIFIYRFAKGILSLLLLGLGSTLVALWVRPMTGIFVGIWMIVVVCLERMYRARLRAHAHDRKSLAGVQGS